MKKVMLLMGLMAFVFFTHAAEKVSVLGKSDVPGLSLVKKEIPVNHVTVVPQYSCTVTQKASVSIYFVTYEISCSSTAETCRLATAEAQSCATEGIARLREIIK